MTLENFNQLDARQVREALTNCCGAEKWVNHLSSILPFKSERHLFDQARICWYEECSEAEYLEAFTHHPKIGDLKSLEKKFASTKQWAGKEQSGISTASQDTLEQLAKANTDYEEKFGYIFIVCATGKSAEEMLRLVQNRLSNSKEDELHIAKAEQFKITILRLKKLLELHEPYWNASSQVTTHVLDTALGKPGEGITITLRSKKDTTWQTLALGITNADGRIADLLPPGVTLAPGHYEMHFQTGDYYRQTGQEGFYPEVGIQFETFDRTHYHVPLLLNPFGYSTYRGS